MFNLVSNSFQSNFVDLTDAQKLSVISKLVLMESKLSQEVEEFFNDLTSREKVLIFVDLNDLYEKVQQYLRYAEIYS